MILSARRDTDRTEPAILIAKVYLPQSLVPPAPDSDQDDSDDESHGPTRTTISIRIDKETTVKELKELCIHKMRSFASIHSTPTRTSRDEKTKTPRDPKTSRHSPSPLIISIPQGYTLTHHISPFVSIPTDQQQASDEVLHVDIGEEVVVCTLYRPGLTQHSFDLEIKPEYQKSLDDHQTDHVQHNGPADIIEAHGIMAYDGRYLYSDGSVKLTLDEEMGFRTSFKIENGPYSCVYIRDYTGLYVVTDADGGILLTNQVSDAALWTIEDDHYFKHLSSGQYLTTGSGYRSISKSTVHVESMSETKKKETKWKLCGPVVEGELQKKAHTGFRPWQRRFFRITGLYLVYWHNKADAYAKQKPSTEYPLDEIKAVTTINNKKHQLRITFKHKHHDRNDLELMADTSEEQARWVRALQQEGISLHHQLASPEHSVSISQSQKSQVREESPEEKAARLEKERKAKEEQEKAEKERIAREMKEKQAADRQAEKERESSHIVNQVQKAKEILQESKREHDAQQQHQQQTKRAERKAKRDAELMAAGILSPKHDTPPSSAGSDTSRSDTTTPTAVTITSPVNGTQSPSETTHANDTQSHLETPNTSNETTTETNPIPSTTATATATATATTTTPTISTLSLPIVNGTTTSTHDRHDEHEDMPELSPQVSEVHLTPVGQVRRTDFTTKDPAVLHDRITHRDRPQPTRPGNRWLCCFRGAHEEHVQLH